MKHDELLEVIDSWIAIPETIKGDRKTWKALRAVVIKTDRPSISDSWQWTDGWKCAMLTIFTAIEKELE